MKKVNLMHNPYKLCSDIIVNGERPKQDSMLLQYMSQRFQLWVDKIPELLAEEYNDDTFEISFKGTELDYQDLLIAVDEAKLNNIKITLNKLPAKEFNEKETAIRKLFNKVKELPFEELQAPSVNDAFNKAFNEEFEVNVVATMSAGKSTLVNALLGKKLMPSKQGACTATITKIKDNDGELFNAVAVSSDGDVLEKHEVLDYKTMTNLNRNPDVSEIFVEGNIPFVGADEISLVLIDTPGPDNARDQRHGLVTAKALNQSSKMLVLFIMNGGKLHDESQDMFLRRIASSMGVGGKQSRERFMFVINKLDAYDEEDDDIAGETIPETIRYLEEMGIENPNVFPAAAEPALLIRRYLASNDEDERRKLWDKIEPVARKLIDQKQLHLEKYPNLSNSCKNMIESELEFAVINNDILGQALVHSGIRGIEETIRMYVTKYCRPAKITNVVNTFKHGLDSASAFEKAKYQLASCNEQRDELTKKLDQIEMKLKSDRENQRFKKIIEDLDVTAKIDRQLDNLALDVSKALVEFTRRNQSRDEMDEAEALKFINEFSKIANEQQNNFHIAVMDLLEKDVKEKCNALLSEYIKKLKNLSEEIGDLKLDLSEFVLGDIARLDSDEFLDQAEDSRTEVTYETRQRKEKRRASGWDRVFSPKRWFNPEYTVEVTYEEKVETKINFISKKKLILAMISPVDAELRKEKNRVSEYARSETQNVKLYFKEKFELVDKILLKKTQELKKITSSKAEADKAYAESKQLIELLDSINEELEMILEI